MGTQELIQLAVERLNLGNHVSKERAVEVVTKSLEAVCAVAAEHLTENGRDVLLPSLGRLKSKRREGRTARNPATGAPVKVPAKLVVKFLPTVEFKEELKKGADR